MDDAIYQKIEVLKDQRNTAYKRYWEGLEPYGAGEFWEEIKAIGHEIADLEDSVED